MSREKEAGVSWRQDCPCSHGQDAGQRERSLAARPADSPGRVVQPCENVGAQPEAEGRQHGGHWALHLFISRG